jgi:hypothetical protein
LQGTVPTKETLADHGCFIIANIRFEIRSQGLSYLKKVFWPVNINFQCVCVCVHAIGHICEKLYKILSLNTQKKEILGRQETNGTIILKWACKEIGCEVVA